MTVLALECDAAQARAIRHLVCDVVHANLTLVRTVDEARQALCEGAPCVVLLPPLIPPSEERELIASLRGLPHGSLIQIVTTPVLTALEESAPSSRRWLLRSPRRPRARPAREDEARLFAQRLAWSLARATEEYDEAEPSPAAVQAALPEHTLERTVEPAVIADSLKDASTETEVLRVDRRASRRFAVHELTVLRTARIQSGAEVSLVDLSAGGALIASRARLQPDTESVIDIVAERGRVLIPFHILRCQLVTLGGSPHYRGACMFTQPIDMSGLVAPDHATIATHIPRESLEAVVKTVLDEENGRHTRSRGR
jgi:hypothetical protein